MHVCIGLDVCFDIHFYITATAAISAIAAIAATVAAELVDIAALAIVIAIAVASTVMMIEFSYFRICNLPSDYY